MTHDTVGQATGVSGGSVEQRSVPMGVGVSIALLGLFLSWRGGTLGPFNGIGVPMVIVGALLFALPIQTKAPRQRLAASAMALLTVIAGIAVYLSWSPRLMNIVIGYLVVMGASEVVYAVSLRPVSGWVAVLFSGLMSPCIGLVMWWREQTQGYYAYDLMGVKLLFLGMALVFVATAARPRQDRLF